MSEPECEYRVEGGCRIAAEWAGVEYAAANPEACKVCCSSDNVQAVNKVTVSLGIGAVKRSDPARVPELLHRATPILMHGFSVTELAKRFGDAAARWAAAGFPRRTDAEVAKLYAICSACDYFGDDSCRLCGCAASLKRSVLNKLSLATESCPDGRWPAGEPEPSDVGDSEPGGAAAPPSPG